MAHVSRSQNWADAGIVLPPDCAFSRGTVVSVMTNDPHSDSEPKRNETDRDPNIRGRVEALKEKVSGLNDTLSDIEKTLEEES